jgi:hypothetical protein
MRISIFAVVALVGCGSSPGASAADSGAIADGSALDASHSHNTADTGTSGAADATPIGGDASAECVTYCTCMQTNCVGPGIQEIPDGQDCLSFCAGFTQPQYSCRLNHCSLVPPQPDNNHCMHAVGLFECIDG